MPSRLVSAHGALRRVLLTVPGWVRRYGHQPEVAPYREAVTGLLRLLPPDTEKVVVTHAEAADGSWGTAIRILPVDDALRFTAWAQDGCLVRSADGFEAGPVELIVPDGHPRDDDGRVVDRVAGALGLDVRPGGVRFRGGNVLVGDDFWLVGADAIRATAAASAGDRATARAAFAGLDPTRTLHVVGTAASLPGRETRPMTAPAGHDPENGVRAPRSDPGWREEVRRGSRAGTSQPLFDLDTFVALAGRDADGVYRLLVGDPRLGAALVGRPLPDHAPAAAFDEVAAGLEALGFRVVRSPLPLVWWDDPVLRRRRWYFASGTNVITEIDGPGRRVWLPTYGDAAHPELEAVDRRNRVLWREAGFEVVALPSFHCFARGLGAARCICKCLARGPVAS